MSSYHSSPQPEEENAETTSFPIHEAFVHLPGHFPASARPTHSVLKYLPLSCLCLIPLINTLPGIRGRLIDFELFLKVVLLINM